MSSSRIPDISVIEGSVWRSMPRDVSAVIQVPLLLAVEVVSPGTEQIERDYTDKAIEYQNTVIPEYWIIDPIEQKITVLVLKDGNYGKTVFTGENAIASVRFSQLELTATEIIETYKYCFKGSGTSVSGNNGWDYGGLVGSILVYLYD
jgi:Uma2 family endonuclease